MFQALPKMSKLVHIELFETICTNLLLVADRSLVASYRISKILRRYAVIFNFLNLPNDVRVTASEIIFSDMQ